MTKDKPHNLPASIRQRLTNLARATKEDFQLVLQRYALERLLYRLTQSPHCDIFILKGAMLFQLWSHERHRPTNDLDFLGKGESSIPRFEQIFREVCQQVVPDDGLQFLPDSVSGEVIKSDQEYEGLRIHLQARLQRAQIAIQVDIGFGDSITPGAEQIDYPTCLDFPAPRILAYPRETVVAEKFQAMVMLGIANSRMKDFYDLWFLARRFDFEGATLARAIAATFSRRRTELPTPTPLALSAEFHDDSGKQTQWRAFLRKGKLIDQPIELTEVAGVLRDFLMPPANALAAGTPFSMFWPASGPWSDSKPPHA